MFKLVPTDGTRVGNVFLRSRLGWSEEEYWGVRKELLEKKLIITGRGRGGSVARPVVSLSVEQVVETPKAPTGLVKDEPDLYEPLRKWLDVTWGSAAKEAEDSYWVDITASPSGRKRESGQWSRPDITFIQVSNYDHLPTPTIEVTSFEVKRYDDAADLSSVYEATSQSRWTHYEYLVVEDSKSNPLEPSPRFRDELSRFGVGLIKMTRRNGEYEFKEETEPRRYDPSDEDLDEFLRQFFEKNKKWLRPFKLAIRTR